MFGGANAVGMAGGCCVAMVVGVKYVLCRWVFQCAQTEARVRSRNKNVGVRNRNNDLGSRSPTSQNRHNSQHPTSTRVCLNVCVCNNNNVEVLYLPLLRFFFPGAPTVFRI